MRTMVGVTAALAAAGLAGAAHAASPFDGTWRSDMKTADLSKRPNVMIVKDGTFECRSCVPPYSIKADGAFHRVKDQPSFDETSLKIVDARTVESVDRRGGRVVGHTRVTAAPDGRSVEVNWEDMTNPGKTSSGKVVETRVGTPAAGEHATSGSWVAAKVEAASQNALEQTFRMEGDVLHLSTPTGQSYAAKVDGPPVPFHGDPAVTTVSVKRIGERELVETDFYKGKPLTELHMTVSPDGRRLTLRGKNFKTGSTFGVEAEKV